jgi:hypothetical protein
MQKPLYVRVIRDPRDAKRDYLLHKDEAFQLWLDGKLALDLTNTKPGEPVYSH